MIWWGWMILGAFLLGAELFAVDAIDVTPAPTRSTRSSGPGQPAPLGVGQIRRSDKCEEHAESFRR